MRERSFRAEVEAQMRAQTADCRRDTLAAMKAISGTRMERRARAGWLRAKCNRCGGCALAG